VVSFSLSLILYHELMLITIASLHHHHNPLFSKKSGQKQASGTSLPCLLDPLFSISVGGSQFQVMTFD
jgi:hypothetical protein